MQIKASIRGVGFLIFVALCALGAASFSPASEPEFKSIIAEGDTAPAFDITDVNGVEFSTRNLRGKIILVNFWATWCTPCLVEMPYLEKEVWQKHKSEDFAMIAIARGQTAQEIRSFLSRRNYSFQIAADPDREIYDLFSEEGLPRSYLIGANGQVVFQSLGIEYEDFEGLQRAIMSELEALRKSR